jgi:ATP-dependent RNA helicase SUPV3L1/SUV3
VSAVTHNLRAMTRVATSAVTAVLGPTNTGKTHLAVERLCGHSSGVMGFPLRLLAREVYDRVVAIKGPKEVGLITGEEKIMPPGARWLLCTAESMPVDRDVAFVALDEAQLGIDPERGHIFTDRLLRARGREETMILGSASLRPMIKALLPEADIISRPRFSQLTYAGAKKLSRLPPRSAIVAFSAEQVYAVAEMLRRTRGGAAVVMGALSPRTRNAQVAMYQAGEVDYLVATDAIGMGLNMDVAHVAFASLNKFDGKRQRRLTTAEIAQIAGRAGRHQRDGTFGTLGGGGGGDAPDFTDAEIERIENHQFAPLDHLLWRDADSDFTSIDALIGSLERVPDNPVLRPAPEAIDLAVLKFMAEDVGVRDRARGRAMVARLWAACQLPDFRKLGADQHGRLVAQVFAHLSEGAGHIPPQWIAAELARLESVQGDVDTIAGRIAAVRTWAYVAHRADWLADPAEWISRASALEEKLSDALHARLTERFVDRRTAVLMRSIGADPALLDVAVDQSGRVTVEGEPIGTLSGFRFSTEPGARLGEKRTLLAAAEQHLVRERAKRARALAGAADTALGFSMETGKPVALVWAGAVVALLAPGRDLLTPSVVLEASVAQLDPALRKPIKDRLDLFVRTRVAHRLAPLVRLAEAPRDPDMPASARAILAQLSANGGVLPRADADAALSDGGEKGRKALRRLGVVVGTLDLFHPALIKPEPVRLRIALEAARRRSVMPPLPMPGMGLLDRPDASLAEVARLAGYRAFGAQMIRVDLVERIARAAHDARGADRVFVPNPALATSIGIGAETLARVLRALGFHPVEGDPPDRWHWRGRPRRKREDVRHDGAFSALAQWRK